MTVAAEDSETVFLNPPPMIAQAELILFQAPPITDVYLAVRKFSLPPEITVRAIEALKPGDLPAGTRLALEKPFGHDTDSARHLNALLSERVDEKQVFRVDHFLGKSTVLNLLGLRFANRLFESVWNRDNVAAIDIVYDETLALEMYFSAAWLCDQRLEMPEDAKDYAKKAKDVCPANDQRRLEFLDQILNG